ncbi:MAG: hypothetical protein IH793_01890, partial [Acidobacteria bacterium]|nr:hypothetical protein [Acidobacteriota bacterium]
QRQAVPLITSEPPCVATGLEKELCKYSGMVVRATNAGTVTYVDAHSIIIDNADEYHLRKFVGLNERTCLNQKPIVKLGQKVTEEQIMADGAGTKNGELALGKNVLVAFNTFDGYNFEDAIVINERLAKHYKILGVKGSRFRRPKKFPPPASVWPRRAISKPWAFKSSAGAHSGNRIGKTHCRW